jgi:hypothetical protein
MSVHTHTHIQQLNNLANRRLQYNFNVHCHIRVMSLTPALWSMTHDSDTILNKFESQT